MRDWLSIPKPNGYRSLHTTVMGPEGRWVEVQIRTIKQDELAERGVAAHWRYKETSDTNGQHDQDTQQTSDQAFEEWLVKIRELLEDEVVNAQDFVQEVKSSLSTDEIFVFTPKGDLKLLPHEATALDFAYAIHTRIGDTCIGAKVNQAVVPLNHRLESGDQVEIITSAKQEPHEDWLQYVKTSRGAQQNQRVAQRTEKSVCRTRTRDF